jgi:hypothetical protein
MDKNVDTINGVNLTGIGDCRLVNGVSVGLLGGSNGETNGVSIGGVLNTNGTMNGIAIGAWNLGQDRNGLGIALIDMIDSLNGVSVGVWSVYSERVLNGLAIGGFAVQTNRLNGVAIASLYNNCETQNGVTIGSFNRAINLHGVQIGLLNYAGNNPRGLRWLPFFNCHFLDIIHELPLLDTIHELDSRATKF